MTQPLLKARKPAGLLPPPDPKPEPAPGDDKQGGSAKVPKTAIFVVLIAVIGMLAYGAWTHWKRDSQAVETQQQQRDFVPTVRVAEAKREADPIKTLLPGQTEAFQTATMFARATGYIAERHADIGSRVKKGDLLVKISAPDLDQQLAQAEAQVDQTKAAIDQAQASVTQAKANLALQNTNLSRSNTLVKQGFETVQNNQTQQTTVNSQQASLTTALAGVKVAQANLEAQLATVDRLKALTAFENVVAPFDGVVTARNVEVGDLVNADQGTGTPLFRVDEEDVLRVAIRVPQYSSDGVRDGLEAKVTAPQMPGRVFTGKVSRTSVALMYSSRTLTTEVDVANPEGSLSPGQFVNVEIEIPRTMPSVSVPSDALIFDQRGVMVATVDGD
jgi:RND family efflux transporter MFP subunit